MLFFSKNSKMFHENTKLLKTIYDLQLKFVRIPINRFVFDEFNQTKSPVLGGFLIFE